MVGLPTETDEDIDAIVRLVKGMEHRARRSSGGKKGFRRLTLSINQFIPKPATPFQWHPLEDTAVVKRRIRRIADAPARREGGLGHPRSPEVELHPGPPLAGRPEGGKAAAGGPPARGQLGAGLPGGEREPRLLRLPPRRRSGRSCRGISSTTASKKPFSPSEYRKALSGATSAAGARLINRSDQLLRRHTHDRNPYAPSQTRCAG